MAIIYYETTFRAQISCTEATLLRLPMHLFELIYNCQFHRIIGIVNVLFVMEIWDGEPFMSHSHYLRYKKQ